MKRFVALRITSRVLTGFFCLFLFSLGLACITPSFAQMAVPSVSTVATSKTERLLTITFIDYANPNVGTNSEASSNAPSRVLDRATISLAEEASGAECYSLMGSRISHPLDYIINPANSGIDQEFVANAVVNAAETWNCASHQELLGNGSIGNDSIFTNPFLTTSTVEFYDFGFAGVIAQTSILIIENGDNYEVLNFHMFLNNELNFGDASNDPNVFDLEGTVAHEFGHVAGLADLYDPVCADVTMYGYGHLGNVSSRTLAEPDLEGLRQIYGTPSILSDATVTPDVLCPPNHEMILVTVNYTITNNCGAVDCELSAISNEPDTGLGDGDVANDIQLIPGDPHHLYLRAECSGSGSGRVYSITVTCADTTGAVTQKTALVTVSSDCDSDGDGVPDAIDQCLNTPRGAIVNSTGCSIAQLVPCDGPHSGGTWKSHGQYVRAVIQAATDFLQAKLITRRQWMEIVTRAAWSKCGWNRRCDHDWDRDWQRNWDCDRDANWGRDRDWSRD